MRETRSKRHDRQKMAVEESHKTFAMKGMEFGGSHPDGTPYSDELNAKIAACMAKEFEQLNCQLKS